MTMLLHEFHAALTLNVNTLNSILESVGQGKTDELITVLSNIKSSNQHLLKLLPRLSASPDTNDNSPEPTTNPLTDALQAYITENLYNTAITVPDLAAAVYMSERSLNRKLKALTGDSPSQWLIKARLKYAKKLLDDSNFELIGDIAYQAGFDDASHFTRTFKSHYATTPGEYRKIQQHGS